MSFWKSYIWKGSVWKGGLSSGLVPFPQTDLAFWFFNVKTAAINNTVQNHISGSDNALLVKSKTANFTGAANRYIDLPLIDFNPSDGTKIIRFRYKRNGNGGTGNNTIYAYTDGSGDGISVYYNTTDYRLTVYLDSSNSNVFTYVVSTDEKLYELKFLPATGKIELWIDGTKEEEATSLTFPDIDTPTIHSIGALSGSATTTRINGYMCDFKLSDTATIIELPLSGSAYDISGNDNHGTPTSMLYTGLTDNFHFNFYYGCDKYSLDSDPTNRDVDIYVPYYNGAPVVTSITGYTKYQSCNVSLGLIHNGCETYIRFPAAAAIMDKSDTDIWPASIRALDTYDSGNPTDWAFTDLFPTVIDLAETDYDNTIFVGCNDNQYVYMDEYPQLDPVDGTPYVYSENVSYLGDIIIYNTKQNSANTINIINYLKRRWGL